MAGTRVASAGDLPPGTMRRYVVSGTPICLAHCDDGVFRAVRDECTHEKVSLAEGWLEGLELECPMHSSIFHLESGRVLSPPATEPLTVYRVERAGDDLLVHLDEAGG